MKRVLFILAAVLMLALFATPSTPARAESSILAGCVSNPSSGPIGTVFVVTCTGFKAEEMVTAWLTEPDGQVQAAPGGKTAKDGTFVLAFPTKFHDFFLSDMSVAVGQWSLTVRSATTGLTMIGRFTVTGGAGGVKGARLTADTTGLVTGTGFLPGEPVSVWVDLPNGDCSSNWTSFVGSFPPIGLSTVAAGTLKADMDGAIHFTFAVPSDWCRGTYHVVARGMVSGFGGEVWLTTANHNVTQNATLTVTPTSAFILGSKLVFEGSGYGAGENVNCWETSPQGATFDLFSFKADAKGTFTGGFTTGLSSTFFAIGEGAVGEWTCTIRL